MSFVISSSAFIDGEEIPKTYTGEGKDISPPLQWVGTPQGTKELNLICEDPDAPSPQPWVHWIIYKISSENTELYEEIPKLQKLALPPGALQGLNSWGKVGYGGPMPPIGNGFHRYFFTLYALGTSLSIQPGTSKKEILQAMDGIILGQAKLMGRYKR